MSFKSENTIKVYEEDGKEVPIRSDKSVTVQNHWNLRKMVVLEVDGKKVTVLADELKRAIDNSTNTHSF